MDRRYDNPLPTAWRGVASPRYSRLARWLSLAEELGGLRWTGAGEPGALGGILSAHDCQAGQMDMTLTLFTPETAQDELREFLTDHLSRHERLVVMLYYAEGLGLEEIADVLDLPLPTVAEIFEQTLSAIQEHFG
ncbi:MAG: sigma factor-like helix-turn-helix DNA-binding protein [bacterium]